MKCEHETVYRSSEVSFLHSLLLKSILNAHSSKSIASGYLLLDSKCSLAFNTSVFLTINEKPTPNHGGRGL